MNFRDHERSQPPSSELGPDRPGAPAERQRIRRTLTFWLRPAFVLRTLNQFQRVAGFDRAIALASSGFTALIPLAIVVSAALPHVDAEDAANSIIGRYGLSGGGAQAVRDVLSPASGWNTDVSLVGAFLLVVAALSFSRGMQRLFEQTWMLKPLSVRNTFNDVVWILGLVAYIAVRWSVHGLLDHGRTEFVGNVVLMPATALFLGWSGRILSGRRIRWRTLAPFAVVGAVLIAVALTLGALYLPHLFSVYASRYGAVGAVLAIISALFVVMLVIVATAAIGHEVSDELERIGRGERPPDDEVRREWNQLVHDAASRWKTVGERARSLRRRDRREPR